MAVRIQFSELAGAEHVRSLKDGTVVTFGMPSPGSWVTANPQLIPVLAEIEKRAPFRVEHIQLDGTCRYEAELFAGTREELLDARMRRMKLAVAAEERFIAREMDKAEAESREEENRIAAWLSGRGL